VDRILRIEGLNGEFVELGDATPSDQPADWKPRWHLQAESRLVGEGEVTLSMELWDCDPAQLALFLAQMDAALSAASGTCFLANGSYPDVSIEVVFTSGSEHVDIALEVWDADQRLDLRFSADRDTVESSVAELRGFVAP
jgi:hypothetical protein